MRPVLVRVYRMVRVLRKVQARVRVHERAATLQRCWHPHAPALELLLAPAPAALTRHTPTGTRTPVAALRTQNPRPLDDGGFRHQRQPELRPPRDLKYSGREGVLNPRDRYSS